jgi:hypothetical protein
MNHLDAGTLADVLFGRASPDALDHVRACGACQERLAEAEEGLALARRDEVPEPSPLYWSALRRNVAARIAEEPQRAWRLSWLVAVGAAALAAIVLVRAPARPPEPAPTASAAALLPAWSALPPLEDDESAPVLEGALADAEAAAWDLGEGAATFVAGLTEEESAVVAETFPRTSDARGGEDL